MKSSPHAKRMERRHQRNKVTKLNLVSLMDIFTILVFFLLLNSGDVEVLQSDRDITLPDSRSSQKPVSTLLISVTKESIFVDGEWLVYWHNIDTEDTVIQPLKQLLVAKASAENLALSTDKDSGWAVTIMGDKSVPYSDLKRVMATCASTNYRDVSLAVNRIEPLSAEATDG